MPATIVRADRTGVAELADLLERGGVAIVPTDTTYGFFGRATSREAVERVYEIKSRDRGKPFVLHSSAAEVEQWVDVTPVGRKFIDQVWPAAVSLLLPKKPSIPDWFTAGLPSVAVMSNTNLVSAQLVASTDFPIFCTTCNYAGEPEYTTAADASAFAGDVDMILEGDHISVMDRPTTIIDCTTEPPAAIRISATPVEELLSVAPDLLVDLSRRRG